ncbi:sensor histidine kinase [Dethiothermospora halolimnae]|uniref:sensor histidine kinase n=1 Tax=Dethiothermospora halolimnae TaxID=3114390 RepID=UPI003CCB979F
MKKDKIIVFLCLVGITIAVGGRLVMSQSIFQFGNINSFCNNIFSFIIIVLFIIIIYFIKRINKEVYNIIDSSKEILDDNLNARIHIDGNSFICDLAKEVNLIIEKLQKERIEKIELENTRKQLLSNMSHDIRTPLTSIIGYIDAIKDGVYEDEKEREEYIDIVLKKSKDLKQMIDNIFEMAKLDAGETPMNFERHNLSEIVRECLIGFLPSIKNNDINLKVDIPEKPLNVLVDRTSIVRVLNNILKNSIIHGKDGEETGVEVIEFEDKVIVNIWDKGKGINNEDINYVFDRLYRADSSRKVSKNNGLGLAVSKKLIELNKGKIWVESIPYEKTTFSFELKKR